MTLRLTFTIKTRRSADAVKMDIIKNFYIHDESDVVTWSSNATEAIDGKRPMLIEIMYDPTVHDFNKICEYISCIEDPQSRAVTHDFNTQTDEYGYHIQFNTTSRKEYEAVQAHCRSLMTGPALAFFKKKIPSDTTSKKEYDPVITFQCTCCNKIFTRKKSECTVMPLKITTTCPNCKGRVTIVIEEYFRQNETL